MKTQTIRNILVPVDFSAMSIAAIETAKRIAERFNASVHLAHAHEFFYPAAFSAPVSPIQPYPVLTHDEDSEKRARQKLIGIAKRAGLSPARIHVLDGSPAFDQICRFAKDLPADLIVMPTHGRTGFKRVLLGSTAERIVQHSPCPVYIARRISRGRRNGAAAATRSILVPTDFSRCSLAGLKYAIAFAEMIEAKIILLHVVAYHYTTNGWVTYELTETTEAAVREAKQQMQKLVGAVKFGAVHFETVIGHGNAVEKICDYARQHDVDLIITSTHGRSGLDHVLMGSVAENVVRRAPCSVLAVPSFARTQSTTTAKRTQMRPESTTDKVTRKYRKLTVHPFPERRKTNRFRETHLVR